VTSDALRHYVSMLSALHTTHSVLLTSRALICTADSIMPYLIFSNTLLQYKL